MKKVSSVANDEYCVEIAPLYPLLSGSRQYITSPSTLEISARFISSMMKRNLGSLDTSNSSFVPLFISLSSILFFISSFQYSIISLSSPFRNFSMLSLSISFPAASILSMTPALRQNDLKEPFLRVYFKLLPDKSGLIPSIKSV